MANQATKATKATMKLRLKTFIFLILLSLSCISFAKKKDVVVMSFATLGDSRSDAGVAINKQDQIWLQNTKAFTRILREIKLAKPDALFFNGDMIYGYNNDKLVLNRQYAYWRGLVADLMETGTYIMPVPGNHEMQEKTVDDQGKTIKIARLSNEEIWRENMGDLIVDERRWQEITGKKIAAFNMENAPIVGGLDQVQTKQSQLSYSFDVAESHFIVINTDPVGNDGHAPTHWLEDDFAKAKERGAKHFFVFGHKPAYTYFFKADMALDGFDLFPENKKDFWNIIEKYKATYFCGHQHIFGVMQPEKENGGNAWQIIVGTAGSPFTAGSQESKDPQTRMYAWGFVKIYASGKVKFDAYGFDAKYGKTKKLKSIQLH
jgi:hypothetical protein